MCYFGKQLTPYTPNLHESDMKVLPKKLCLRERNFMIINTDEYKL